MSTGPEPLPVFCPSRWRPDAISTHLVFPSATIVVHNEQERQQYIAGKAGVDPSRVVVSGVPVDMKGDLGIIKQREYISQHLVPAKKWYVEADDDVTGLTAVRHPEYDQPKLDVQNGNGALWREVYEVKCHLDRFWEICQDSIRYAERVGARFIGFALVDNFFFRGVKFRSVGYVLGTLNLKFNDGLQFNPVLGREDMSMTADHLLRFGAVAINNFLIAKKQPHFSPGGLGTHEQRTENHRAGVRQLMLKYPGLFRIREAKYPGLFRIREAKDYPYGSDLCLRLHTPQQIAKWRRAMILRQAPTQR